MRWLWHLLSMFRFARRRLGGDWYRVVRWDDAWESYTRYWTSGERPRDYTHYYYDGSDCGQYVDAEEHYPNN